MLKLSVKTCLLISSSSVKNREKSLRHVATAAKFLNLNKPCVRAVRQFLLAELFEYSPMHDCSDLRNKTVSSPFATLENTIIILLSPPKCCITIVFSFSWDLESSQKKLKLQWLCKMFFCWTKRLLWYFLKWPILFFHKIVEIQEFCYHDKVTSHFSLLCHV